MQTEWLADSLWTRLEEYFKHSKTREAAIAYISDDSKFSFKSGDRVVVNASDAAIQSGATSARLLQAAWRRGVRLYCCETLHAKTILFDGRLAYVGSANLSSNSFSNLNEFGVVSNSPDAVVQVEHFIQQLVIQSKPIDEAFINRILNIEIIPASGTQNNRKRTPEAGKQFWLVGISNKKSPDSSLTEKMSVNGTEEGESYDCFWLLRNHKNCKCYREAREGDEVILIDNGKKQNNEEPDCWHVIICEVLTLEGGDRIYRYRYNPQKTIEWKQFQKLCEEEKIRKPKSTSVRGLTAIQFRSVLAH